jgi:hypothetical protein
MNQFEQLQRDARKYDRVWITFIKSERELWAKVRALDIRMGMEVRGFDA